MLCTTCEDLTVDELYQRTCAPAPTSGWSHGYYILFSSYQQLESTAQSGCENCHAFRESFVSSCGGDVALSHKLAFLAASQESINPVIAFLNMGFSQAGKRPITKLHLQIGTEPQKPGDDRLTIAFRISKTRASTVTAERKKEDYIFRFTQIDHDLGSQENFSIAKNWIQHCCAKHDAEVCQPITDNILPTRLIDVGSADGSEEPRLVQPPKGRKGRYLALSHCWGPTAIKERLLTKESTLDARMKAIPMSLMPANFYDATIITRKLGFQYSWIDSLCIMQDSTPDWEAESQNMGNIYTRAALTIAAAAAKDSDGGMLRSDYQAQSQSGGTFEPSHWFLIDRKEINNYALPDQKQNDTSRIAQPVSGIHKPTPCHLKVGTNKSNSSVILEPWMTYSDLEENWFRCTAVAPLAHRGWCLQERLLSRRVLFYGARQIYWQCASSREAADGEIVPLSAATSARNMGSGASEFPDLLGLERLHASINSQGKTRTIAEKRIEIERQIFRTWHNVLFLYVNRRLTYQTDKLPGLAGMASLVGRLTGDVYVAGFWRSYLLVSLVWTNMLTTVREYELRSIAERYEISKPQWEFEKKKRKLEGPSWSWASADIVDRLDFWADHDEEYRSRIWTEHDAKILEVETELLNKANPYGAVLSGRLVLQAFTFPKWDVRTSGWDPWDIFSSIILSCCPHSPWSAESSEVRQYRPALWDYSPRQALSPIIRVMLHLFSWLAYVFKIILLEMRFPTSYGKDRINMRCSACMEYLQVHMLSLVDKVPKFHGKSEMQRHEVDLWSLILEPVPGENETYRRIGITRQVTYLSEEEFEVWKDSKSSVMDLPEAFSSWKKKTVTIV